MKILKTISVCLGAVLLSACAQVKFAAVNAPTYFDDVKVLSDVSYGEHDRHRLDVYSPKVASLDAPVVVFFHGGRWTDGDKSYYRFVGSHLAKHGYVVVVPNYRTYPDVKFPTFVEDTAQAIAWVSENISQYGGDATRINLMGHSSGAHMAALVAADTRYLRVFDKMPAVINSVVGLSGPYDFTPREADLVDMFGPPENFPNMVVTNFIDGDEPPVFLLWGGDDTLVGAQNINRLSARILEKGGAVDTKIYEGIDHVGTIAAFTWAYLGKSDIADDVLKFLEQEN